MLYRRASESCASEILAFEFHRTVAPIVDAYHALVAQPVSAWGDVASTEQHNEAIARLCYQFWLIAERHAPGQVVVPIGRPTADPDDSTVVTDDPAPVTATADTVLYECQMNIHLRVWRWTVSIPAHTIPNPAHHWPLGPSFARIVIPEPQQPSLVSPCAPRNLGEPVVVVPWFGRHRDGSSDEYHTRDHGGRLSTTRAISHHHGHVPRSVHTARAPCGHRRGSTANRSQCAASHQHGFRRPSATVRPRHPSACTLPATHNGQQSMVP
jgi:hypothetical protein